MAETLIDKQLDRLNKISNSFTNFTKLAVEKRTKGACQIRMQRLEKIWEDFEKDHFILLEDEEADSQDNYFKNNVYDSTEEIYLSKLGLFQDQLISYSEAPGQSSRSNQSPLGDVSVVNQTKLPQIELPDFHGDIREWLRLGDTFKEMIIKRTNLASVFKMHYLHQCLKARPKGCWMNCQREGTTLKVRGK